MPVFSFSSSVKQKSMAIVILEIVFFYFVLIRSGKLHNKSLWLYLSEPSENIIIKQMFIVIYFLFVVFANSVILCFTCFPGNVMMMMMMMMMCI